MQLRAKTRTARKMESNFIATNISILDDAIIDKPVDKLYRLSGGRLLIQLALS